MDFSLAPKILGYIWGFPITNTFWVLIFISILLIVLFAIVRLKLREVPKGLQLILEILVEGTYNFIHDFCENKKISNILHPFALTVFLLFITGNLLSFIPGISLITFKGSPIYRTATTDYNMVLVIAALFLAAVQVVNIATGGLWAYIKRFINLSSPLNFVLGIFEIIGETARLVSISFRFFGNAFAGDILIAVLLFIFPFVLPLPFMGIILLSSVVQPVVFALLATVYLQMAIVSKKEAKKI